MTKEIVNTIWKELRYIYNALVFVMVFSAFSMMLGPTFGVVEGEISPVIVNFKITKVVDDRAGSTLIWGTFDRVRDCPYEKLLFRVGDADFSEAVEARVWGTHNKHLLGPNTYGPWQVFMDQDTLLHQSQAAVEHSCHIGWNTTTQLYTNQSLFYGPSAPS